MKPLQLQDNVQPLIFTHKESLFNKLNYTLVKHLFANCIPKKEAAYQKWYSNMNLIKYPKNRTVVAQMSYINSKYTNTNKSIYKSMTILNPLMNQEMQSDMQKEMKIKTLRRNMRKSNAFNIDYSNRTSNIELHSKQIIQGDNMNSKCMNNSVHSLNSKGSTLLSTPNKDKNRLSALRMNNSYVNKFSFNREGNNSSGKSFQLSSKKSRLLMSNRKSMSSLSIVSNRNYKLNSQNKNSSFSMYIQQSKIPLFDNPVLNESCGVCLFKKDYCII